MNSSENQLPSELCMTNKAYLTPFASVGQTRLFIDPLMYSHSTQRYRCYTVRQMAKRRGFYRRIRCCEHLEDYYYYSYLKETCFAFVSPSPRVHVLSIVFVCPYPRVHVVLTSSSFAVFLLLYCLCLSMTWPCPPSPPHALPSPGVANRTLDFSFVVHIHRCPSFSPVSCLLCLPPRNFICSPHTPACTNPNL